MDAQLAKEYGEHRGSHIAMLNWLKEKPEVYNSPEKMFDLAMIEVALSDTKADLAKRLFGRYRALLKAEHLAMIAEGVRSNG